MRTFSVGGIIVLFILIQFLRSGEAMRTIDGDGSGYYAYLPAVFIYGTTDFSDVYAFEQSRRNLDYMAHYFHQEGDRLINKYYMGTALLLLPFFLLAWLYSAIIGLPLDGYNFLFQYSVSFAAALYAASGLIAGSKLLESFGIDKKSSTLTMILLLLATNLFHYTFIASSHSHVYSFAAISWFLLNARRFFTLGKKSNFRLMMLLLGLAILIRPVNALVILALPFLAGSWNTFVQKMRSLFNQPRLLASAVMSCLFIVGLQIFYNFLQSGRLIIYAYREEGFNWLNPAFASLLFSYRKGLFVYTPVLLLIFPGMILLYRKSTYWFYTSAGFLLILIYVFSSWWNWFYGSGFGMRVMVDYYSLLAVPLGMIIMWGHTKLKGYKWVILFLMPFVSLNLFQTYQYYHGIIHTDAMNKEKYWYVFLKTDASYRKVLGGFPEPVYNRVEPAPMMSFFTDMESLSALWTSNGIQMSDDAYSGQYLAELSQSNIYSPTLVLQNSRIRETYKELYVKANLMFRELEPDGASEALLVYATTDTAKTMLFYKTFRLKQLPDQRIHEWRSADFGFKVPAWTQNLDQVKIYVWNRQKGLFQMDDFEIEIYRLN